MPKFIYKGGEQIENAKGDTSKMPAEIEAFGIEFLRGKPVKVEAEMFRDAAHYQHALGKLRINRYFEEVTVEDAAFEEVAPDKPAKKGRRVAALPAPEETPPE
jgi:hypothetical protein